MGVDLANTLGALLIGVIIVSVSYGAVLVQTYLYFQQNASDSASLKSAITVLWFLGTVHQLFICHGLYVEVIIQKGDPVALETLPWSIIAIVPITSAMNLGIRSVFCFRIWKLSGRNWLRIVATVLLSLIELGIALGFFVIDRVKLHTEVTTTHTIPVLLFVQISDLLSAQWMLQIELAIGCIGWAFAVVADATLTVSQTQLLWRSRVSSPRTDGTDSALRILMLYSVSNGVLSSVFAFACFLTWITMSDNRIYLSFFCATPSLLLNALLATLNGRQNLRGLISGRTGPSSMPTSAFTSSGCCIPEPVPEKSLMQKDVKALPPLPGEKEESKLT
ncbi:hypothetical protein OBBRIDRAFT_824713 [Obba rivulosa]|uniref:DUF6534 domain-containing protein n=1 Tax=Obba rivulosa TaxID=1052685 RepID=A0A8E2DMP2_9APHY|nr:hypothetical protein OBBRIDRAFT_824713 [Obba rivulosa]